MTAAAAGEDTVKVVSTKVAEHNRSHAAGVVGRGLQETLWGCCGRGVADSADEGGGATAQESKCRCVGAMSRNVSDFARGTCAGRAGNNVGILGGSNQEGRGGVGVEDESL